MKQPSLGVQGVLQAGHRLPVEGGAQLHKEAVADTGVFVAVKPFRAVLRSKGFVVVQRDFQLAAAAADGRVGNGFVQQPHFGLEKDLARQLVDFVPEGPVGGRVHQINHSNDDGELRVETPQDGKPQSKRQGVVVLAVVFRQQQWVGGQFIQPPCL